MSDFEDLVIAGLTVKIDRLICVGFEDCTVAAPAVFAMDDEGIAIFAEGAEEADREEVIRGCESCPVDALVAIEADGTVLVP